MYVRDVDLTPSEIIARLRGWGSHPDELVGIHENQEVEFKTMIMLDTPAQKVEFAKNVSAMTNGGGGIIVVGIRTERDPSIGRDISSEVVPLPPGLLTIPSLEGVARTWVYPPARSLSIREWVRDVDGYLLVSITVPLPGEEDGLSLVQGAEVEERVDRRMFTVASRFDSRVDTYLPSEVYEWIRRGRRAGAAPGREQTAGSAVTPVDYQEPEKQFERAKEILGDEQWPTFVLQAWVQPALRLTGLHDEDGITGLLRRPPSLRQSGFNLRWWGASEPELEEGGGVRFPGGHRGTLWLTPNGVMTLAANGGPDLLGWGMERRFNPPTINPLVLVELTHELIRLYFGQITRFFEQTPSALFGRIALLNADRPSQTKILRGSLKSDFYEAAMTADKEIAEIVGPFSESSDPREVSAALLRRFYDHFGLGDVPYLTSDGSAVDEDAILRG
jgi:hypothetical protein